MTAREVAATIAFLASPAASGITGTTVTIDAGLVGRPPVGESRQCGAVLLVTTPL